ncbi:acyl carrier protein [Gammaproteobacteria bacterium]|nr:acyl carrier protein [Gammaproteobacteria bacterium]
MNVDPIDRIICETLKIKVEMLDSEMSMENTEEWDSLSHMELVMNIEEELKINLEMEEIMMMVDVESIRQIVSKKVSL